MSCLVRTPPDLKIELQSVYEGEASSEFPADAAPTHSGLQPRAVQGMLDFDFICKRTTPSVAGIIYTFGGQFVSKM